MRVRSYRATLRGAPLLIALSLGAVVAIAGPSSIARAEPSTSAVEEGRSHFTRGVSLFRANDFRAALVEFRAAYAVAPSFRIQFNIGQTCAELQDHGCAARAFEVFLADGGKQVPPGQRVIAERELKRLRALVGSVRVIVNVSGAEITIDDAPAGTAPLAEPALAIAGRRKITATKPPFAPVSANVDVVAGETVEISLALVDAAGAELPPAAADGAPSRTPFWIGVGVTGALAVGTVTLGVLALGAKSDLDATVGRFGASADDIGRARSKVDGLALATDVIGVAMLAAAGVTTYLFFATRPPATRVGVGPGWISVAHAF
jgi:PEGA domain-containing protein